MFMTIECSEENNFFDLIKIYIGIPAQIEVSSESI